MYRRTVGIELRTLANSFKRELDSYILILSKENINMVQAWILCYILEYGENEDVFQRDLERFLNVRRSTATGILKTMERKKLISKQSVSYDKRLKKLVLTPKAYEISKKFNDKMLEMEKKLTKGLSEQELDTLFTIIDKMKKNSSE